MRFYNPYHFVPAKEQVGQQGLSVADVKAGNLGHVAHDRFISKTQQGQPVYSGRLLCRLTTEDPTVVGATRIEGEPHTVLPFQLPTEDKPAIPASTLRGLIASIAEAASNSALRVLENRSLSYRVSMEDSLSAIGMIVEGDQEGAYRLRPLALPTMQGPAGSTIILDAQYRTMFPIDCPPPLKVYVGNFSQIRDESFVGNLPLKTFSWDRPQYCYAKLNKRSWNEDHALSPDPFQYRKPGGGQEYLLSQITTDNNPPLLEHELPHDPVKRSQYTRGILRVLGAPGREDAMPQTKKHELFTPYPEDIEARPTFPILPEAIDTFYQLADERTKASRDENYLPYEPRGTRRNQTPDSNDDHRFRLKVGDLVYFLPDAKGETVAEISLSAIWRRQAGGTSHTYFEALSKELLPFHQKRQTVSIGEQLFGFVEHRHRDAEPEVESLALASRLRFSFGRLHPDPGEPYYEDRVLLKILDAPKLPAPAFYFKSRHGRGSYIPKTALHVNSHVPQGRKFYLHRPQRSTRPWRTSTPEENKKQKSYVTPIKSDLPFYFHIDFENLSEEELGLLCYAIRPVETFRHKMGMGKPIGLGKVRLDPVGLFYIDRQQRYNEKDLNIFEATRYHSVWLAPEEDVSRWPPFYACEQREVTLSLPRGRDFEAMRDAFANHMDPDIKKALELLGDPQMVPPSARVHTPQVEAAAQPQDMERETYTWFVENERNRHQFLKPLTKDCDELPWLDR